MNDRPNIKVTLTLIDKTLEVLGWLSCFCKLGFSNYNLRNTNNKMALYHLNT